MDWEKLTNNVKKGMDRIEKLLEELDNPQNKYKTIHIAGTNGKGSVATILERLLRTKYKTGLYTSPHLVKLNERIKINGVDINDEELEKITNKIDPGDASFFEYLTAVAYKFFEEKKVEIAIIEVGLGGKYDATNVITPEISIITNIGSDHLEYFGTKQKLFEEKCGIIKKDVKCLTTEDAYLNKIKKICEEKNCELVVPAWEGKTPLKGIHQIKNTALAVEAARFFDITDFSVLKDVKLAGRLDFRNGVLFDGAHNVEGIKALIEYIKDAELDVLIIGFSKGKNCEEMLKLITPFFEKVIYTKSDFKPENPEKLAKISPGKVIENPEKALKYAKKITKKGILVTGSLYLIGKYYDILKTPLNSNE